MRWHSHSETLPSNASGGVRELWGTGPDDIFAVGTTLWHYDGAA